MGTGWLTVTFTAHGTHTDGTHRDGMRENKITEKDSTGRLCPEGSSKNEIILTFQDNNRQAQLRYRLTFVRGRSFPTRHELFLVRKF